jgi:hypothetical protein
VLFSDDDAGIRGLQVLQEQREQVQQQLAALKESMADVAERVTTAQQEHRAACKAAGGGHGARQVRPWAVWWWCALRLVQPRCKQARRA